MANIGELTVGLLFVPDDASIQRSVQQAQQSLGKGLATKLTLDDTEFQQAAQKSISQNRQLERQANEERRAERQRYINFWKQSLSEQDAEEKRQAQASAQIAREAAAEKKRAANEYSAFWKQALKEQEQQEKAASRAAIQAQREKEAEERRASQEGMQRLRNANQTAKT